jgi:hypothetical protein
VPSEHSNEAKGRQGAINTADSPLACRMLVPALTCSNPWCAARPGCAARLLGANQTFADTRFKRLALAPT